MSPGGESVAARPRVTVEPAAALLDEPVSIRVAGLPPGQPVTLRATMIDHFDRRWRAQAAFVADAAGAVDVAAQAPVGGSYASVDPMGLFWAMTLDEPGGPPVPVGALDPLVVDLAAEADGRVVAEARLERRLTAPGGVALPVRDDGLAGLLCLPPGPGPHPAVLVLGGSEGGLIPARAGLLAARGYAALALAYFNHEHLPPVLHTIPLEYFAAAIGWLRRRPEVRADRLAVIGFSRGGELALLLGATFPELTAVIGYVPSGVLHAGVGVMGAPAWTYRGEPLPYLFPPDAAERWAALEAAEPIVATRWFLDNLADRAAVERATIAVERINGPVLLLSGEDDRMWPSAALAEIAVERLARHGHPHAVVHRCYPGVGHQFGLPNVPTTVAASRHRVVGRTLVGGGTPQANARAARAAWAETLAFLDAWRR